MNTALPHTSMTYLEVLKHTAREEGEIDEDENIEWNIERIIARRSEQMLEGTYQ